VAALRGRLRRSGKGLGVVEEEVGFLAPTRLVTAAQVVLGHCHITHSAHPPFLADPVETPAHQITPEGRAQLLHQDFTLVAQVVGAGEVETLLPTEQPQEMRDLADYTAEVAEVAEVITLRHSPFLAQVEMVQPV
jgi:hypothetical protein